MRTIIVIPVLTACLATFFKPVSSEFLRASGSNFYYGQDKVFLSGANFAWNDYGFDFGNDQYDSSSRDIFESWMRQIHSNGGNAIRIWVHVEGYNSPEFDLDGRVVAPDRTGTLLDDLSAFVDFAYDQDIFVILVLWNGAVMGNDRCKQLFYDDSKLQTYIDRALVPLVRALKDKPSLAAWEIINEPEGSVKIEEHWNPIYDTSNWADNGAGWAGANIPMERILRFLNWLASAIHSEDPKALVSTGSWCEIPRTDQFGLRNYYLDDNLIAAGGRPNGVLDFNQIHTYALEGSWRRNSPFKVDRWAYQVNEKPLVIGEFSHDCSEGEGIEALYDYAYTKGYSGALTWQYNEGGDCADTRALIDSGLRSLRGRNDPSDGSGGLVNVNIRY